MDLNIKTKGRKLDIPNDTIMTNLGIYYNNPTVLEATLNATTQLASRDKRYKTRQVGLFDTEVLESYKSTLIHSLGH